MKPFKHAHDEQKEHADEKPDAAYDHAVQRRGENIAFATEAVATCFATDFIDPFISHWFQREHAHSHGGAHGTAMQNILGEVGGDLFSAVALIVAEEMFHDQMRGFSRNLGKAVDPLYDKMARAAVSGQPGDADYQDKLEQWKHYQRENLAKTLVISAAGIGGNVALQKSPLLGNPSPASVIFKGKLLGAGITTAVVVGSRLAFPRQTKAIDAWLSEHVFAPLVRKVDRMRGAHPVAQEDEETPPPALTQVQGEPIPSASPASLSPTH